MREAHTPTERSERLREAQNRDPGERGIEEEKEKERNPKGWGMAVELVRETET